MAEWHDLFVTQTGASAALAGLLFVGISLNLAELVKFPHLVLRAAGALVISSLLLVPTLSGHTA